MICFYAPNSFWNTPIATAAAVDVGSAEMIATSITPYVGLANFANTDEWGVSLVYASPRDKVYTLTKPTWYDDGPISFKIPAGAKPSTGSDHHLVVVNGSQELDLWDAQYNGSNDTWWAGSRFITNSHGWGANGQPGQRAGGAVAAGFAEMGGVVRPEEIAQGHIDHALSMTVPVVRANEIAGPATATDGVSTNPNAIPEGAYIQLNPGFDVDTQPWPTWEKTIAKALQRYGAYVSDTGGSIAFYGQTDINVGNRTWNSVGTPKGGSLANLPWGQMRVLQATTTVALAAPAPSGDCCPPLP